MNIGERIKELRKQKGFTQQELAQKLGLKDSAIAKYENGRVENIKRSTLAEMAKILECSPVYLLGLDVNDKTDLSNSIQGVEIPVLGRVAAGIPITATEYIIDTEEISLAMASDGEYFALQIKGDSMEPKISNGDVVIVRKQSDADDGDLVIALVNGDDAVCKRLKKYEGGIALLSNNPSYEPLYFSNKEIDDKPVSIIGKVKELRAKF